MFCMLADKIFASKNFDEFTFSIFLLTLNPFPFNRPWPIITTVFSDKTSKTVELLITTSPSTISSISPV